MDLSFARDVPRGVSQRFRHLRRPSRSPALKIALMFHRIDRRVVLGPDLAARKPLTP